MQTNGGFITESHSDEQTRSVALGSPALGSATAVMGAFTDNGKYHRFVNAPNLLVLPDGSTSVKITADFGGVAADIKAVQVIIIGTDVADAPLTESLPAATVNTAGQVVSVGLFKTITSIEIPAHDGTGATTKIGIYGHGTEDVLAAWTDKGVNSVIKTATITNPDAARNVTSTAGGTAADVAAISPIVVGKNASQVVISETLPAFTVNTTGAVTGNKAFSSISYIDLPAHDGTGATTAFGTGSKLGIGASLSRDTILNAYLAGVREGTRPTVAFDSDEPEKNTVILNSALNGTAVIVDYYLS